MMALSNQQAEVLYVKKLADVARQIDTIIESEAALRALMVEHSFDEHYARAVLDSVALSVIVIERLRKALPYLIEQDRQAASEN